MALLHQNVNIEQERFELLMFRALQLVDGNHKPMKGAKPRKLVQGPRCPRCHAATSGYCFASALS